SKGVCLAGKQLLIARSWMSTRMYKLEVRFAIVRSSNWRLFWNPLPSPTER
ncbi:unnamed protein product, partial [Musa hybrid cultivar]